ncbi:hypothetical protein HDV06_000179 [Boothiomyces sp. JEL0866]|nr:hypothetical protein HDV06_000179 [Boothiomyces sp. JEL0866]
MPTLYRPQKKKEIFKAKLENDAIQQNWRDYEIQRKERREDFDLKIKELQNKQYFYIHASDEIGITEALHQRIAALEVALGETQSELHSLHERNQRLLVQNEELKKSMCKIQTSAEEEEEFISNTLLKRIETLQKEKQALLVKVEAEEEKITNQLQKKLNQLQREKVQMEITLEQEQECIVNKLQKQVEELKQNQMKSRYTSTENLTRLTSTADLSPSQTVVEMLKAENDALKSKMSEIKLSVDTWAANASSQYSTLYEYAKSKVPDMEEFPGRLPPFPSFTAPDLKSPASSKSAHPQLQKRLSGRIPFS